jgi:hypothetical protein
MGRLRSHYLHHLRAMRRQVLAATADLTCKTAASVPTKSGPAPVLDTLSPIEDSRPGA